MGSTEHASDPRSGPGRRPTDRAESQRRRGVGVRLGRASGLPIALFTAAAVLVAVALLAGLDAFVALALFAADEVGERFGAAAVEARLVLGPTRSCQGVGSSVAVIVGVTVGGAVGEAVALGVGVGVSSATVAVGEAVRVAAAVCSGVGVAVSSLSASA